MSQATVGDPRVEVVNVRYDGDGIVRVDVDVCRDVAYDGQEVVLRETINAWESMTTGQKTSLSALLTNITSSVI